MITGAGGVSMSEYETLEIRVRSERDAPRAGDIGYRCARCGGVIPSVPDDNVGCSCGNVFIDIDCVRLIVEDFAALQVVRKSRG